MLISTKRIDDNVKHHIVIQRKNGILQIIIDGVLNNSINYTNNINWNANTNIFIGWDGVTATAYLNGYVDELRIIKNKGIFPDNFVLPSQAYNNPYGTINIPLYLQTSGLSDYSLTTMDTITSLTIPTTVPANTSIKCLFSVDNKTNWLYYDGTNIQKFTGILTSDWGTTCSSYMQIQTLFTNLTITNLTTMLSSLGITPVNLDFAFQLNTTDINVTPSISPITMVYTTFAHEEYGDIGKYDSIVADYGIKRINNSTLAIKNLKGVTKTIKLLVVTDGSGSGGSVDMNTLPTF